jgi:hypothetical protein
MVQILYTIAAIMILAVVSLTINLRIHSTGERLMFNELTLEMTGVATELLDQIGRREFDAGTISGLMVPVDSLTPATNFGTGMCEPDQQYSGCFTISDFHNRTATRIRSRQHAGQLREIEYNVTDIQVLYVDQNPPHDESTTPTFAKEVTLTISTPAMETASGGAIEVRISRIFMYPPR